MTILKFFSKTCGPCKWMSNVLSNIKGAYIEDIDIEEDSNSELVERYGVKSIPTLIFVDNDGSVITELRGIVPLEKIQSIVDGQ